MRQAQPTGTHCPLRCPPTRRAWNITSEFLMWRINYTTRQSLLIKSVTSSVTSAAIAAHVKAILCVNNPVSTRHWALVTFTGTVQKNSSGVVWTGTHSDMAKRTAINLTITAISSLPRARNGCSARCIVCRRRWSQSCRVAKQHVHPSVTPPSTLTRTATSVMGFVDYSARMYLRSS